MKEFANARQVHKPHFAHLGSKVNPTCTHCYWSLDCHQHPEKYPNCVRQNRFFEYYNERNCKLNRPERQKHPKNLPSDNMKLFVKKDGSCPNCEVVFKTLTKDQLESVEVVDVSTQPGYVDALYYGVMSAPALMYDDESKIYDPQWIVEVVKGHYDILNYKS